MLDHYVFVHTFLFAQGLVLCKHQSVGPAQVVCRGTVCGSKYQPASARCAHQGLCLGFSWVKRLPASARRAHHGLGVGFSWVNRLLGSARCAHQGSGFGVQLGQDAAS
jgi:hypothetical protein